MKKSAEVSVEETTPERAIDALMAQFDDVAPAADQIATPSNHKLKATSDALAAQLDDLGVSQADHTTPEESTPSCGSLSSPDVVIEDLRNEMAQRDLEAQKLIDEAYDWGEAEIDKLSSSWDRTRARLEDRAARLSTSLNHVRNEAEVEISQLKAALSEAHSENDTLKDQVQKLNQENLDMVNILKTISDRLGSGSKLTKLTPDPQSATVTKSESNRSRKNVPLQVLPNVMEDIESFSLIN